MARAIEQNHSNAEQLESQISALELERARISEVRFVSTRVKILLASTDTYPFHTMNAIKGTKT